MVEKTALQCRVGSVGLLSGRGTKIPRGLEQLSPDAACARWSRWPQPLSPPALTGESVCRAERSRVMQGRAVCPGSGPTQLNK